MPISENTRARSVVATLGCLGAAWAIESALHRYGLSGLQIDVEAVRGWLAGQDLYATGTAQTPAAALLIALVAALPLVTAGWLLGAAGTGALLFAMLALVGPVVRRYGRPRWPAVLLAGALALQTEPVRTAIGCGRLDLLLFGLVTADVVAFRRQAWARCRAAWWPGPPASRADRPGALGPGALRPGALRRGALRRGWATGAWAGVGTGLATALAVAPVVFVVYLAITGRWRAALTAVVTTAAVIAGSLLFAPGTALTWLDRVLPVVDRSGPVGAPVNQSLAGVLARLYDSDGIPLLIWLSFSVLLLVIGMVRARAAHQSGDEITAFTLVGLVSAAVGPVTHTSEMIWLLPAVLILVDAAARRRVTARRPRAGRFPGLGYAVAAVAVGTVLIVDPLWTNRWDAYAVAVIVLVSALPWRTGNAPLMLPRRPAARIPAIPGPRGR